MNHRQEHMQRDLARLVACRTTADNKPEILRCFGLVESMLADLPLIVRYYERNGNISMVWSTENTLNPDFILSGHLDVVPGPDELYQMRAMNGRLIGRGVSDMKFAIPVYAEVIRQMYRENRSMPSLAIMLTSDEEAGGMDGTGYLVNEVGYRAKRAAIIPDGGDNWHVVANAKGALQLEIKIEGVATHAGEPWTGVNAIVRMTSVLSKLIARYPEPTEDSWGTTVNLSELHAGSQVNQVPHEAVLKLDIRHPHQVSHEEIIAEIQELIGDAEITVLNQADSFSTDIEHDEIQRWIELLKPYRKREEIVINEHSTSDGRFFTGQKIPTIVSLPECGKAHADEEWLGEDDLHLFASVLLQYLSELPAA